MSTHTADRAPLLRLGPTRAIARRSGAVRCAMAIAVAAFGCGQVLAVENGAAGTIVGAGLVALAAPLARGRRRALLATAAFVVASLALDADAVAVPGLAAVVLLTAMLVSAPAFRASGDPATRRLIVPAAVLLAIGIVADLARAGGHLAHPLAATLLVGAGLLAARTLRPWGGGATDDPEARARAARIVARYATDTLAPFTLRADKQFFFATAGTGFIAYRVVAGVALVSGDPVGDEAVFPALVEEFARFAERRGWTLGVLGASARRLPLARRRPPRPLHGGRGDRRSLRVLDFRPLDAQGTPVRHAARAGGLLGAGRLQRRRGRDAGGAHRRDRLALAGRPQRDGLLDGIRGRRRRSDARRPLRDRARRGR